MSCISVFAMKHRTSTAPAATQIFMTNPTISSIMPVFNRAYTVETSLLSMLNQTYPPTEIIVVDDGSDDDLVDALAPYRDEIHLVRQQNLGVAAAQMPA